MPTKRRFEETLLATGLPNWAHIVLRQLPMIVPLLPSPHLLKYLVTIERHGVPTRPHTRSNKLTVDADSVALL